MKKPWLPLLLIPLVVALIAGCPPKTTTPPTPVGAGTPPPAPTSTLSGTIRVSGAFALYPMVVKWQEEFCKLNPGVKIDISAGGAGKGATDALGGLVDIGMVSRAVHEEEIAKGGWWVPVVKDAVFPTINEKNPALDALMAQGVKKDVLAGIWITETVKTWGQVAGTDTPDKIHVFTRSDACGAAETWAKYLAKRKQEDLKGTAVYADPGLAESVVKDPLAIGFNNLNYAYDAKTGQPVAGIRIAPLDANDNGTLDPEESFYGTKADALKAIQDGRYPSPPARDLNFLCKGKPSGVTLEFIKWALTDGQQYAEETGYVTLPAEQGKDALAKLD